MLLLLFHITNIFYVAGFRSVSAVDTAAAQRARARAQYSNMSRLKISSGAASLRKYYDAFTKPKFELTLINVFGMFD